MSANLIAILRGWGVMIAPADAQYVEALVAAAVAAMALTIGWLASRAAGPRLAHIWEHRAGYESALARRRIRDMTRRFVAAMVIGTLLNLFAWGLIASVILGLTLAIALGLFVNDLVRGVRLPNWMGTVLGLLIVAAIVASLFGGIEPITVAMERVGFDIGMRRFSLLWLMTIVITILLLFIGVRILGRIIAHGIDSSSQLDPAQKLLGQKIAGVGIIIAAFFIGIDMLGIDLTALSFFSGAFGLAVGFGLQKTIGNLFAGIILLMDRSIKPGDIIVVGDSFGWVNKIGVRAVSVLTRDGKEHLIPNENLMTTEVENWSYSDPNVRMRIPVNVSYKSDMKLVEKLLYQAVSETSRVLKKPEPRAWMTGFGESGVNWEVRCWINDPREGIGNIKGRVLMRLWDLFQEHGIEIPFPQRDLHIKDMPRQILPAPQDDGAGA